MHDRGAVARRIARGADIFSLRVAEHGVVRLASGILYLGPCASPDEIVTVVCRRILERDGVRDEAHVAELVERYGFEYVTCTHAYERSPFAMRATARGAA